MCQRTAFLGLLAFGVLGVELVFEQDALAGQASLAWDASDDTRVTGYFLYYGQAPQSYSWKIDAGNRTSVTVPDLTNGQRYFFGVTAYGAAGIESAYSNEASTTIPASTETSTVLATSVNPASLGATVTFTATVSGVAPLERSASPTTAL